MNKTLNFGKTFQAQSASSFECWKVSKIVPRNSYCDNLSYFFPSVAILILCVQLKYEIKYVCVNIKA